MSLEKEKSQPSQKFDVAELLIRLDSISENEINVLRSKITDSFQDLFNRASDEEKKILTLLFLLNEEEISSLEKILKKQNRLPGIHDVLSYFHFLYLVTQDEKFHEICLKIQNQ
jgi:DNA anti-recombination protein RmuC